MNWKSLFILVAAFILYLVIGALVFSALESTQEEETKIDLRAYKEAILSNFSCISEESLEQLVERIMNAVESGVNPLSNVSSKSNWDFSSSFFFSGTVVTTIGYGHISPSTNGGRGFCVIYALIGIPLFGILMAAISEILKQRASILEKRFDDRCLRHPKIKSVIYAVTVLALSLIFFMIIPAAVFSSIEKWTFSESFYYAFVTLSTIGFGDFVIGTNPDIDYHILYKWCTYCWIIIGLAFLALVIGFISDAFTSTADKIQHKQEEMMKKRGKGASSKDEEDGKDEGNRKQEEDGNNDEVRELKDMSAAEV
ncbi:potassium channel subfamily K member 16-like isoform X2 [Acanthaster planci]|uniref:Potassium channel subfamily K member 16-like isoform X2 n=1 Tax=Acanthaster planci TaxID=133434 RepID=A0A8B7YII1_ACAPL|nr:potassium channel subfamily K member 16-like isoform X2 [Acanthaster planci]